MKNHETDDLSPEFPAGLFGRGEEIKELLDSAYWIGKGKTEYVVISGAAGIGKTSLTESLRTTLQAKEIVYITGKCEAMSEITPYYGILQSLHTFFSRISALPTPEREAWKTKINAVLGPNVLVLSRLLPVLNAICEVPGEVEELGPVENKNRLFYAFQELFELMVSDHPICLFLDDLQWIDPTSVQLLEFLMLDAHVKHLLLILAYRDNEIIPGHQLLQLLKKVQRSTVLLKHIALKPLSAKDVRNILQAFLGGEKDKTISLASFLHVKSQGNPFFLKNMLRQLNEEGYFSYKPSVGCWEWDEEKVENRHFSDDVSELLMHQIRSLDPGSLELLKLGSALGNKFNTRQISLVNERKLSENTSLLWKAVTKGYIIPFSINFEEETHFLDYIPSADENILFRFVHDKVQQASYALIPPEEQEKLHLFIARKLIKNLPKYEMHLFQVVKHYNIGRGLITEHREKEKLADMNLAAGKKIIEATGYKDAILFLEIGIELVGPGGWEEAPDLTFELHKNLSEALYLNGDYDRANQLFKDILGKISVPLKQAGILTIRMNLYQTIGKFEDAIHLGEQALALLGHHLPGSNFQDEIYAELNEVQERLKNIKPLDLVDLPLMTDARQKAAMEVFLSLYAPVYNNKPELLPYLTLKMMNLSMEYGNTNSSPYAYMYYGVTLCAVFSNYREGARFGKVALALNEKLKNLKLSCKLLQIFGTLINPWNHKINTCYPYLERSFSDGVKYGDLIYSGFSVGVKIYLRFISGEPLASIREEAIKYEAFYKHTRDEMMNSTLKVCLQTIMNLEGKTFGQLSLNSEDFKEKDFVSFLEERKFYYPLHWYYLLKMELAYLYKDYAEAQHFAGLIRDSISTVHFSQISVADFHFYDALNITALQGSGKVLPEEELAFRDKALERLNVLALSCPENFLHRKLIVEAEISSCSGALDSLALYEQAIREAANNGYTQDCALANELAASLCLRLHQADKARAYAAEASRYYEEWGALRKSALLKQPIPMDKE